MNMVYEHGLPRSKTMVVRFNKTCYIMVDHGMVIIEVTLKYLLCYLNMFN